MATVWSHTNDAVEEKAMLTHIKSAGAISISPELFEKLYLTPKTPESGQRFANPTAMGFVGFVISTFTFSMVLMGWGGAEGTTPVVGIFFFTGPVLLILTTIFEFILGNFFSMMVCSLFAVFWLSFGCLQLPTLGLATPYAAGSTDPHYNAVIGLYLIVWGFALGTFFVFTLMTNCVFAGIFFFVTTGCWTLAAAYFRVAAGDYATAGKLQTAGAAMLFIVAMLGWYMTFVIMAAELRMSVKFPVGDLSHFWRKKELTLAEAEREV